MKNLKKEITLDSFIIFFASWAFFLIYLKYPITRNFDEFHYIPSALQWLHLEPNQNWEHPPLAKLLIAIGVGIGGDTPFGWRLMSTLFGSLTLVGVYHLALALFSSLKNARTAAWVCTLLTFFNQLLYVQSRIAMLDTFMMAFLIWSLWGVIRSIQPENVVEPKYLKWGGICMGLAIACKWFALVPYLMCAALLMFEIFRQESKNKALDFLFYWLITPALFYFLTFLPYLWVHKIPPHTLSEIFTSMQTEMWSGQKRVVNPHPYMSQWWEWIILKRPIWYAFDHEGDQKEFVRGVILLGNPILMWGGLLAIFASLIEVLVRLKKGYEAIKTPLLILFFYFGFSLCWIAIPRAVAFYYYYVPAGTMLSFACTHWLMKTKKSWITWGCVGAVAGVFIYFFPILAALKIRSESFVQWMWLRSWI